MASNCFLSVLQISHKFKQIFMAYDTSCSPFQPVCRLIKHIFRKIPEHLTVKLEGITIIVNPIYGIQTALSISLAQTIQCLVNSFQIASCCFLRKQHFVMPVQTHKIILFLSEYIKQAAVKLPAAAL